jgi:hypothetical protein
MLLLVHIDRTSPGVRLFTVKPDSVPLMNEIIILIFIQTEIVNQPVVRLQEAYRVAT